MVTLEVGEFAPGRDCADAIARPRDAHGRRGRPRCRIAVLALRAVLFSILVYAMLWRPQAPKKAVYRTVPASYHEVVNRSISDSGGRCTRFTFFGGDGVRDLRRGVGRVLAAGLSGRVRAGGRRRHPAVRSRHRPQRGRPYHRCRGYHQRQRHRGGTGDRIRPRLRRLPPRRGHRPKLARYTTGLPASLYFVGFTGGVLTLGVIGFIAGPVVIALLVERRRADQRATGDRSG